MGRAIRSSQGPAPPPSPGKTKMGQTFIVLPIIGREVSIRILTRSGPSGLIRTHGIRGDGS